MIMGMGWKHLDLLLSYPYYKYTMKLTNFTGREEKRSKFGYKYLLDIDIPLCDLRHINWHLLLVYCCFPCLARPAAIASIQLAHHFCISW
jgi:hypothetical protein